MHILTFHWCCCVLIFWCCCLLSLMVLLALKCCSWAECLGFGSGSDEIFLQRCTLCLHGWHYSCHDSLERSLQISPPLQHINPQNGVKGSTREVEILCWACFGNVLQEILWGVDTLTGINMQLAVIFNFKTASVHPDQIMILMCQGSHSSWLLLASTLH